MSVLILISFVALYIFGAMVTYYLSIVSDWLDKDNGMLLSEYIRYNGMDVTEEEQHFMVIIFGLWIPCLPLVIINIMYTLIKRRFKK